MKLEIKIQIFLSCVLVALLIIFIIEYIDYKNDNYDGQKAIEKPSPYNWIEKSQIHIYDDKFVVDMKNTILTTFTDTNSMDPIIDENSHGIEIVPKSKEDIHTGDIVSYRDEDITIIHRVFFIGEDEKGWYCLMKGDNNEVADPGRIRFSQIRRVLIGIIY